LVILGDDGDVWICGSTVPKFLKRHLGRRNLQEILNCSLTFCVENFTASDNRSNLGTLSHIKLCLSVLHFIVSTASSHYLFNTGQQSQSDKSKSGIRTGHPQYQRRHGSDALVPELQDLEEAEDRWRYGSSSC
jgi:hypothetical protein